uniref:LIM zinc-binding domain-containing protein n=1 Tax=Syphacia muris TaxID=451379 RepID=A0A0N5ARN9_9BILA
MFSERLCLKETYSKFKEQFEKLPETLEQSLEEKMKEREIEMAHLGKENLLNLKGAFENPKEETEIQREKIVVERSDADKKRILSAFTKPEMTAEEAPRECAVCSKTVYPVERVFANKCLYHNYCFKCSKCSKKLLPTNYNMHEGVLLCKVHYMEVFNPDVAKTMNPETTEGKWFLQLTLFHFIVITLYAKDERVDEEDEDFAVSSKPKKLGADVVRCYYNYGTFVKGETEEVTDEEKRKPLEDINLEEIGNIKNKWKTGNVEGAELKEMSKEELEELRKGPGVKERFKERTEAEETVQKQWDQSQLDTTAAADARRSFLEGSAYRSAPVEKTAEEIEFKKLHDFKERFERGEESEPIEKTEIDVKVEGLGDIKAAFEKGGAAEEEMLPEERAALKQKEIDAEFLRYKLARRAAAKRAAEEKAAQGENAEDISEEILPPAEVGSIKDRFEKGEAFKSTHGEKQLDVEIKMAGKAREKFQQIDAEGLHNVAPAPKGKHESKWDKKQTVAPEIINKREISDEPNEPEDEDAYDVKNLMNKFKNIGNEPSKTFTHERPLDLEGIKVEAKNLKEQFEKTDNQNESELAEEKRRQLEEEFARLKEEKEVAQAREALEEPSAEEEKAPQKEEIQVAADHASKMTEKWEKIQRKEARKAEKSKMRTVNKADK